MFSVYNELNFDTAVRAITTRTLSIRARRSRELHSVRRTYIVVYAQHVHAHEENRTPYTLRKGLTRTRAFYGHAVAKCHAIPKSIAAVRGNVVYTAVVYVTVSGAPPGTRSVFSGLFDARIIYAHVLRDQIPKIHWKSSKCLTNVLRVRRIGD